MIASTVRTTVFVPASSSWTGSLLTKPVAASTAPAATAAPCPKSGYSMTVTSAGVKLADASNAWSMIQDDPYLPGIPMRLPLRSAALLIPDASFAKTIEGNRP